MMTPSCPVCGGDALTVRFQVTGTDPYLELLGLVVSREERVWMSCDSCGHLCNGLRLGEQELTKLYERFRDQEWRNETPDQYFDRITSLPDSESENYQKMRQIMLCATDRDLSGLKTMIDIGCGGGVLIHTAQRLLGRAFSFCGVEPTASFADLATRRTGAMIRCGNFRAGLFGDTKFDLATCCQVLEHVSNPGEFVSGVRRSLVPEGLFYLEVPDVSDFADLPSDHDRFMCQHISYFSYGVLSRLLLEHSFTIVASDVTKSVRKRNNLWFLARAC